jgi:hypothetical protein
MHRFDRPLRLDSVLFALSIGITAAFAVDCFVDRENEKTAIARAKQLRESALARASEPCPAVDSPAIQSDASAASVGSAARPN